MKRLLLSLWLVGAVLYTISTLLWTSSIWFNDDDPKPIVKDVTSPSPADPKVAKVEPAETAAAQPEQFEPISPAAVDTPHAIAVEQAPSEAPVLATLPSSVSLEQQPPPAVEAIQAPASSIPNQAELLKVTSAASIHNGPSASADVIGTAYAGAQVQVASRDSGWTQFVDPSSGHRGWIDSTVLAPLTPTVDTAATEDSKQMSADEAAGALIDSKPTAKAHGSNRHYGRRRFAFRFGLMRFRR
jgi:hypothetical protein